MGALDKTVLKMTSTKVLKTTSWNTYITTGLQSFIHIYTIGEFIPPSKGGPPSKVGWVVLIFKMVQLLYEHYIKGRPDDRDLDRWFVESFRPGFNSGLQVNVWKPVVQLQWGPGNECSANPYVNPLKWCFNANSGGWGGGMNTQDFIFITVADNKVFARFLHTTSYGDTSYSIRPLCETGDPDAPCTPVQCTEVKPHLYGPDCKDKTPFEVMKAPKDLCLFFENKFGDIDCHKLGLDGVTWKNGTFGPPLSLPSML